MEAWGGTAAASASASVLARCGSSSAAATLRGALACLVAAHVRRSGLRAAPPVRTDRRCGQVTACPRTAEGAAGAAGAGARATHVRECVHRRRISTPIQADTKVTIGSGAGNCALRSLFADSIARAGKHEFAASGNQWAPGGWHARASLSNAPGMDGQRLAMAHVQYHQVCVRSSGMASNLEGPRTCLPCSVALATFRGPPPRHHSYSKAFAGRQRGSGAPVYVSRCGAGTALRAPRVRQPRACRRRRLERHRVRTRSHRTRTAGEVLGVCEGSWGAPGGSAIVAARRVIEPADNPGGKGDDPG